MSKAVYKLNPRTFEMSQLKNMIFSRKEHAVVHLQNYIYAMGGYDGSSKKMLDSCERYSIATNQWT